MELKLKLKVKNKEIELTKEEAQELVETLRDIFSKEKEYVPYYPYYPRPWWYWDGTSTWPKITCGTGYVDSNTYTISNDVELSYSYG